jgi:hypothetical protein
MLDAGRWLQIRVELEADGRVHPTQRGADCSLADWHWLGRWPDEAGWRMGDAAAQRERQACVDGPTETQTAESGAALDARAAWPRSRRRPPTARMRCSAERTPTAVAVIRRAARRCRDAVVMPGRGVVRLPARSASRSGAA